MAFSMTAYKSTYELLAAEGFSPEQRLMTRARISTSEKGKRYVLVTNGVEESVVYAVDGDIVKEGQRCDKLVLVKRSAKDAVPEHWTEIFVELKGVDAGHAIGQLRETLKNRILYILRTMSSGPVLWHTHFLQTSLIP